ncbi:transposase [Streptomyces sp. JV178]|uniref:transposase n=1 Tax=Streptomyces sp. JV178 TaxID=858632 RepID=UPI0027D346D9|nr:transposase [Streptomyces sp. JV178]
MQLPHRVAYQRAFEISRAAGRRWSLHRTVGEPLLPAPRTGPKGRRREKHPLRRTVDAIMHVVRTGCARRQLPHDFPPL